MRNSTKPTDAVLEAMVQRVEAELLTPHHRSNQHKLRVRITAAVGGGILLLVVGLSVAAVALPHPATVPEVQVRDANGKAIPNAIALTIQCFNEHPSPTHAYGRGSEEAAARHDPDAICVPDPTASAIEQAIQVQATTREAAGASCGLDTINDGDTYLWNRTVGGDGQVSTMVKRTTALRAPGCDPQLMLEVAQGPAAPTAVCAIDANDVVVYARNGQSAEDFCDALGEELWTG